MNHKEYSSIRHATFSGKYELDDELMNIANTVESHKFLANPASLNVYLYLMNYVKAVTLKHFADDKPLRILDWGCGKGQVTYLLKKMFKDENVEIISCDVAEDLAGGDSSFGQDTPIIERSKIIVVPLTHESELPFPSESFDVVISMGVLEHVPNDQDSLKEICRLLRTDGLMFCFCLPYTFSWTQKIANIRGDYYHDHFYNDKIVDRLLSQTRLNKIDSWHRALLPKNTVIYPRYELFEKMDQFLCETTPLKYLATNIEFLAIKK
jgi:ubiquinone/menaquinone biosynthesis C-methylase UbiE